MNPPTYEVAPLLAHAWVVGVSWMASLVFGWYTWYQSKDRQMDPFCPVCYQTGSLVTFPCTHVMCTRCVTTMLIRDSRCCMCRAQLTECRPTIIRDTQRTLQTSPHDTPPFGLTLNVEHCVTDVTRGSVADRQGVRAGDHLVGVNGLPCKTREVTQTILRESKEGCRLVFSASARPRPSSRILRAARLFRIRVCKPKRT